MEPIRSSPGVWFFVRPSAHLRGQRRARVSVRVAKEASIESTGQYSQLGFYREEVRLPRTCRPMSCVPKLAAWTSREADEAWSRR